MTKSRKQKQIERQLEYEKLVDLINNNRKNFLIFSVQYYFSLNPFYFFSHIFAYVIALSSYLKKREPWVHSCYLYKHGINPRLAEAIGSGVTHTDLFKYFRPNFKGRVDIHVVPGAITKAEWLKEIEYVEKISQGKRYSILKAMGAWFDFSGKDQIDSQEEDYCSDNVLDALERMTGKKLFKNNAEVEPSELHNYLKKKRYRKIYTIDSKRF